MLHTRNIHALYVSAEDMLKSRKQAKLICVQEGYWVGGNGCGGVVGVWRELSNLSH